MRYGGEWTGEGEVKLAGEKGGRHVTGETGEVKCNWTTGGPQGEEVEREIKGRRTGHAGGEHNPPPCTSQHHDEHFVHRKNSCVAMTVLQGSSLGIGFRWHEPDARTLKNGLLGAPLPA